MAKKKTQAKPQPMSPERYIKERARTLPIECCYINKDWEKAGEASIMIVRRHPQDTYTIGYYLVDTFCRGVIDSFYKFSLPGWEFREMIDDITIRNMVPADYVQVHNLIYGAISFAEEAGIAPHKSFELTRYLLEEDTDDVPLIEYDFGKDGMHCLLARTRFEANQYLPLLRKNLGMNFTYTILEDTPEERSSRLKDEEGNIDIEKAIEGWKTMIKNSQDIPETPYTYQHPEYPGVCDVENQWLLPLLYDHEYCNGLPPEQIEKILALPHDSLRRDLEQIILFETGCTCDEISPEQWEQEYMAPILHGLFLLGEVGDENSLKVVLETLRQKEAYYDYHFGDFKNDAYIPTLYLLGKDQLPALLDFAKEPGLSTYAHYMVFPAVALIARRHPERRAEVIEWFRQVLLFYTEKLPETTHCDGILTGLMMSDLIDIQAKELLPEIKALYDTGLVDNGCCGDYLSVEEDILSSSRYLTEYMLAIYKRYEEYKKYVRN